MCSYESIFVRMAAALLSLQRPDGEEYAGLWGPSLVNWEDFPVGETSGTAFYVAGFAYGITNGLLSVEEYGAVRPSLATIVFLCSASSQLLKFHACQYLCEEPDR